MKKAIDGVALTSTLAASSEGSHEPQDINALSCAFSPSIIALGILNAFPLNGSSVTMGSSVTIGSSVTGLCALVTGVETVVDT